MTLSLAGEPLLAYLLASVRIFTWLMIAPPFAGRTVPTQLKAVLAVALAMAVAPITGGATIPDTTLGLLLEIVGQVFIGGLMGFVTMMLFSAVAAAGSIIDLFGGFAISAAFDPLNMTMNTIMGKFHAMLAMALLIVSGGHLLIIGGLLKTFAVLPVGEAISVPTGAEVLTTAFGVFFVTAVQIALPLVAVLFVADLGLALLTKIAPHLNAINVMFPAKIGLTLLVVGMSFPVLPGVIDRLVELILQAMSTLAGGGG
ncbi:flagellar biosynthetic protein FliR [Aeromicrobium sp. IC_218]|uniref:flagellar biosynthetic protein FliR n=1 Tax=Aeromicrobium sp. IC_218 TaxID=2545468 RepID=UPI00103B844F|nr:flagellar biosynthetic protein FliR [Aeromicrobium sp. IC_218]TCI99280.1 type III secretion protein [Aeromicrobium sp. IC_218]